MDLKEAEKIVSVYGGFIEWALWRLNAIFFYNIPESLLPYSVKCIEEASNIVAKSYHDKGDKKTVEDIQRCKCLLVEFKNTEEAMFEVFERFKSKTWYDCSINIIKSCREVEKKHISGYFKEVPLEKVDFDNLNFYNISKVAEIYSRFIRHAHMRLSFIFCGQIPESLLPFPKESLAKAFTFYTNLYGSTGDEEKSEAWAYGKTVLEEDYVDDDVALNQLIKNFSDKEVRDSIISDIKEYQLELGKSDVKMKKCPYCGTENKDEAFRCKNDDCLEILPHERDA